MLQKKRKIMLNFLIKLIFCVILNIIILGSAFGDTNIKWSITSTGGGHRNSATYNLFETFGFHMFGSMSSNSYNLSGGAITTDVNDFYKDKLHPENFKLEQNYPNPFNPTTNIQFELPEAAHVELVVYNVLGQKVKELVNKEFQAGYHNLIWYGTNQNGEHVGSGTYLLLIRVKSDNKVLFQNSKKMSFLK